MSIKETITNIKAYKLSNDVFKRYVKDILAKELAVDFQTELIAYVKNNSTYKKRRKRKEDIVMRRDPYWVETADTEFIEEHLKPENKEYIVEKNTKNGKKVKVNLLSLPYKNLPRDIQTLKNEEARMYLLLVADTIADHNIIGISDKKEVAATMCRWAEGRNLTPHIDDNYDALDGALQGIYNNQTTLAFNKMKSFLSGDRHYHNFMSIGKKRYFEKNNHKKKHNEKKKTL